MVSRSIYSEGVEDFSTVHSELLEALLQSEEIVYPWNPAEPEAEVYFSELEQDFEREGWLDGEINQRSQQLFSHLDACWTTIPDADELKASLFEKFATRIPQDWLEAIAQKAHQMASSSLSLADQLVECVQELLPNWAEEDLLVVARPFAYAMRGTPDAAVDNTLSTVKQPEWTKLSAREQAQLTMAIARYAIAQLEE